MDDMAGWTEASAYRKIGSRNRGLGLRVGRPKKQK